MSWTTPSSGTFISFRSVADATADLTTNVGNWWQYGWVNKALRDARCSIHDDIMTGNLIAVVTVKLPDDIKYYGRSEMSRMEYEIRGKHMSGVGYIREQIESAYVALGNMLSDCFGENPPW